MVESNTVTQFATAALTLINTAVLFYIGRKTAQTELNTNSMKDALVASTKLAAHSEGLEQGRAEGVATAATLAKGVVLGKNQPKGKGS
jgi:hypothetical protein